ncbi:MAG: carboxysome shell carbonic anhydrase [Humidesulfovibrio sp.]|uniref:carboxysome shell carbonic anhydrase domain-containg protein n=1 Tax=Humidesulfovibrio sp. TaxID=2910988 RepID=UPI002732AED5|nr:carboxysome shell carbonic anhydrase domain-containg protein [Humidesulfovibrio sp.]MDP2847599.1 carboxysome shell carbonic anhydrase [Humidesulfovibrio sp.]
MSNRSIHERIDWLWNLGREHAREFCTPEAALARKHYLAQHPTHVMVLKCMDGRIHLPFVTGTPLGIIEPLRNLGGMFHLGWPLLGEVVANSVSEAVAAGRRVLVIITYHFSKGDPHRGCAGFGYDKAASVRHVHEIRRQMEYTFGQAHQTVYPVVFGFETDEDALILHGPEGVLDLTQAEDADEQRLAYELRALYPDMPARILADLLPLVQGNIRHIAQVRASGRELATEHREWVICVGRGFDFLHVPNMALIIGPYSPDLSGPIARAAGIIQSNMESGRIPDDGFLLLASAPYREAGMDRARAELKSRFLSEFADEVIRREWPDLHPKMLREAAVLDWNTRTLTLLNDSGAAAETS